MKLLFIISLFFIGNSSFGQVAKSGLINRVSIELGGSTALTKKLPGTINISLVNEFKKGSLVSLGYYTAVFKDREFPKANLFHTIDNFTFSIGKIFYLKEKVAFSFSTGPSYVNYIKPVNIRPAGFSFFGGYNYDEKIYKLLGWCTRIEAKTYTNKYMGFSIGGVLNYNSKRSTGGLNANFIIYLKPQDI